MINPGDVVAGDFGGCGDAQEREGPIGAEPTETRTDIEPAEVNADRCDQERNEDAETAGSGEADSGDEREGDVHRWFLPGDT